MLNKPSLHSSIIMQILFLLIITKYVVSFSPSELELPPLHQTAKLALLGSSSPSFSSPTKVASPPKTKQPSRLPSISPDTAVPSTSPTNSFEPTSTSPSLLPTVSPTSFLSFPPIISSTSSPTKVPSPPKTKQPTRLPSISPATAVPSTSPTNLFEPTSTSPSLLPTLPPTSFPSFSPTKSIEPTSVTPSSNLPTTCTPRSSPTKSPLTKVPSTLPSSVLSSKSPLSVLPTTAVSGKPTSIPSTWLPSSISPTVSPSSISPTTRTVKPTKIKTTTPSMQPSMQPSFVSSADEITYHSNGLILLSPKIINIYVGLFSSTTMDLIDYLAAHLDQGTPSWYSVVKSYSQVVNGKVSYVGAPSFIERWTFNPSRTTLDDGFLQSLIAPKITSRGLLNCTQCIFAIIFNGGFQMAGWNGQSGWAQFCGYHTTYGYDDNRGVSYVANIAVIGDPMTTSPDPNWSCIHYTYGATANNDPSGDSIATTYMHEIADVITNYDSNAWFNDITGYEVADPCIDNFGDSFNYETSNYNYQFGSKRYLVQTLFQSRIGCVSEYRLPSLAIESPILGFHEPYGMSIFQMFVTFYYTYLGNIQYCIY